MLTKLVVLVVIGAATAAVNAVYFALVRRLLRRMRLAVASYTFGIGPAVLRLGLVTYRLVPWAAGFVPVQRRFPLAVPPEVEAALARGELVLLDDLPRLQFMGLTFLPLAIPFAAAALLTGPAWAVHATLAGTRALLAGALSPLSAAASTLDGLLASFARLGTVGLVARGLATSTAINVIWFPINLTALFDLKPTPTPWPRIRFLLGLVARLVEVLWLVAAVAWLARP